MLRLFDDNKIKEIIADYERGMTLKQVAEKYACSWQTVQNYVKRYGGKIRRKGYKSKYNIHMLKHDWNADRPIDKIVQVYGFPSRESVYRMAGRYRGMGFKRRGNMIQSEEITEGCIRQTKGR